MIAQSQPLLQIERLAVAYGRLPALAGVDLSIARGEVAAIVGPSGCGKSTLLASLNRLTDLIPNCRVSGSIRFAAAEVVAPDCDLLQLRRRIGMVFQKPNPFPLSIRRNLALPLREHRVPKSQMDDTIEDALRAVGLWDEVKDRLDAAAPTLSGGQQQRLCIARALALSPEVMLFDEPCSALDPIASGLVEELIASLRDRLTVVIVTHNLAQARRMADTITVLWQRNGAGTVLETGPTEQMFAAPSNPIVADYLAGTRGEAAHQALCNMELAPREPTARLGRSKLHPTCPSPSSLLSPVRFRTLNNGARKRGQAPFSRRLAVGLPSRGRKRSQSPFPPTRG